MKLPGDAAPSPAGAQAALAVAARPVARLEDPGFVFHSRRCEQAHRQAWNWSPRPREELESQEKESQRNQATAKCAAAADEQDSAKRGNFQNLLVGDSEAG